MDGMEAVWEYDRESERQIRLLVEGVEQGGIPKSELFDIIEYLDHNELQLAMARFAEVLAARQYKVDASLATRIMAVGDRVGLSAEYLDGLLRGE